MQIVGVEILPDQAATFVDVLKDQEAMEAAGHGGGDRADDF